MYITHEHFVTFFYIFYYFLLFIFLYFILFYFLYSSRVDGVVALKQLHAPYTLSQQSRGHPVLTPYKSLCGHDRNRIKTWTKMSIVAILWRLLWTFLTFSFCSIFFIIANSYKVKRTYLRTLSSSGFHRFQNDHSTKWASPPANFINICKISHENQKI